MPRVSGVAAAAARRRRRNRSCRWFQMSVVFAFVSLCVLLCEYETRAQATSSTSVRVIVPDLAGMLYPMQEDYPWVEFGASASASLFTSTDDADPEDAGFTGTSIANAACNATSFCVDLVFTSVFEADPFLLTRYESKFPVNASVSDGLDVDAIQPVIIGGVTTNATWSAATNATWTAATNTTGSETQTWWRFSTDDRVASAASRTPTIDLLLRFKQQSQFRSKKDQLLIHFVASLKNKYAVNTAIESFSLYGNQRVAHSTSRLDSNRVQIAFAIGRNATQRDVIVEDAYPLAQLETPVADGGSTVWVYQQPECLQCASLLYDCSIADLRAGQCDYDTSKAPLLVCLRDTAGLDHIWYKSQMEQPIGAEFPFESFLAHCVDAFIASESNRTMPNIADHGWWNATVALSCLANHQCPVGPFNSVLPNDNPEKMFVLANATTYVQTATIRAATFTGYIKITFAANSSAANPAAYTVTTANLTDTSTETTFAAAIATAVGGSLDLSISVRKTFTSEGAWILTVSYVNLLLPDFLSEFKLLTSASGFDETHTTPGVSMLQVAAMDRSKLVPVSKCAACAKHLDACQQDDPCRDSVLPCLITQLTTLAQLPGVYEPQFGATRVDFLAALHECTDSTAMATWNPVRKALLCYAQHQCAVGSSSSDTIDEATTSTVVKIENGTQVFAVSRGGNGTEADVALTFSRASGNSLQTFRFHSAVSSLPLFLRSFVLQNGGDVVLQSSSALDASNPSSRQIALEYFDLLGDLPIIAGDSGDFGSWVANTPVKAFFEYNPDAGEDDSSTAGPVLDSLLALLREKALSQNPVGRPSNHTWTLAPECLRCSATLFECSTEDVANRTCSYNTMASVFGRCLRDQLPTTVYQNLLRTSNSSNNSTISAENSTQQMVISSELSHCARKATSSEAIATDSAARVRANVKMNAALSCFAATQCPFGPLEIVQSNQTVVLDTSPYVHLARVHSRKFQVALEYRFGDRVFAQVPFTHSVSHFALLTTVNATIAPSGVTASLRTFENEAAGTAWTIEFHYSNVVLPGFSVRIVQSDSAPSSKPAIEQFLMKASPRLLATPRDRLKVFHAQNASLFRITNESLTCSACRTSGYLEACRKSRFCQNVVLPCVVSKLSTFTGLNALANGQVEVTPMLRACASSATSATNSSAFYSWWAPLQSLFACYARSQCQIATISSSPSGLAPEDAGFAESIPTTMVFTPGEEELHLPIGASGVFSLAIRPASPGTSLPQSTPFAFTGNTEQLGDLLLYVTQGTAGDLAVTNTTSSEANTSVTHVRISYGDEYMGLIPSITSADGGYSSAHREPRLVFTATQPSSTAPDWSGVLDILRNASDQATVTPTCSACEAQFLTMCRNTTGCRGKLLQCLADRIEDDAAWLYGVDRDIMDVLRSCASDTSVSERIPLHSFLSCYEQAQCLASESEEQAGSASESHPTFLRLQPGVTSFSLPSSPAAELSATIWSPDGTSNVSFSGTLEHLRVALFESFTDPTASMRIRTRQSVSSSGMLDVDIVYDGYYSDFPFVEVMSGDSTRFVKRSYPKLILFSSNGLPPTATHLVNTLARYMLRPECSQVCSDHLTACTQGDSRASLVCREVVLPCVNELLSSSAFSGASGASVDLSSGLRECTRDNLLASLELLEKFLSCYEVVKCPLNTQDGSSVPTYLSIQVGAESLLVTNSSATFTIDSPAGFEPVHDPFLQVVDFSEDTDASDLQNSLQHVVLESLATVQVLVNPERDDLIHVQVTYRDYLGELPVITGDEVQSVTRSSPQVRMASKSTTQPPSSGLLQSRLEAFMTTTPRTNCSARCATDHLASCIECGATILPCLVPKLLEPISSNGTEVTPTSDQTGVDFTDAMQSCVADLLVQDWAALGGFFQCLMEDACPLSLTAQSSGEPNATYAIVRDGYQAFLVSDDQLPQSVSIIVPTSLYDLDNSFSSSSDSSSDASYTHTVVLNPADGYAEFSQFLNDLFGDTGTGAERITVVESLALGDDWGMRNISVHYDNYYGPLPLIDGTEVMALDRQAARMMFQSLGGAPNWDALLALLEAYSMASPSPVTPTPGTPAATPAP